MADDIVTRLRIAGFDDSHPGDLLFQAADEIERLRAVLDAIDGLHQPTTWQHDGFSRIGYCDDGIMWPCPTHLILYPYEARRG